MKGQTNITEVAHQIHGAGDRQVKVGESRLVFGDGVVPFIGVNCKVDTSGRCRYQIQVLPDNRLQGCLLQEKCHPCRLHPTCLLVDGMQLIIFFKLRMSIHVNNSLADEEENALTNKAALHEQVTLDVENVWAR